ncbi:MAG: hypothetical protein IIV02_04245 [Peptococcaceae bacterium]|nr:hypothetical protein [Peptococcaceae bacterium]
MSREYVDERTYRILHNRCDEHGNVVEQFYRYYDENETDEAVYLTKDFLLTQAKQMSGNSASISKYTKREKPFYYEEVKGGKAVQIDGVTWECNGTIATVTIDCTDGNEIVFAVPVE